MELTILQRVMLLPLIPVDGVSVADLRIANELQNRLGFTEEEQERFQFVQADGRLDWDSEAEPVEIEIGPRAHVLMQNVLNQMAKDKTLNRDQVELYDLFNCDEG